MKWSTANFKNQNYNECHEIYVGTETGSFKKLMPQDPKNPYAQKNLQDIKKLDKDSRITALAFGNKEQTQIFIGHTHQIVDEFSICNESFERGFDFKSAPIVGVAHHGSQLIAGSANGDIQVLPNIDETASCVIDKVITMSAGDDMAHLRQCQISTNIVATGGKGRQNNLKVFDLAVGGRKPIFTSKNLPNDFLQLEVPIWDSDIGFLDDQFTLATCSRYGYVRLYDTRKQRRPVQCYAVEDGTAFSTLIAKGNYIYTGTTTGVLKAFDVRSMKNFVHTYKGFTGSISDLQLDATGKCITSACLDRFVRVHNVDSTVLLFQCYVKSKATKVLVRESEKIVKDVDVQKEESNKGEKVHADVEYEELFTNMETVNDDNDASGKDENILSTKNVNDKREKRSEINKCKRIKL